MMAIILMFFKVSTHSRPKAAGMAMFDAVSLLSLFQHTAARRRLGLKILEPIFYQWFQHTAARRRLVYDYGVFVRRFARFNTQPPEGGWHEQDG